jgi:hypothetical protein
MTTTDHSTASLESLARLINIEQDKIITADRKNLERAFAAGEMLIAAKDKVKHKEWYPWLEANCPKVSKETANLYMRLAKNETKIEEACKAKSVDVTDLTINEARQLIAKPKPEGKGKKGDSQQRDDDLPPEDESDGGEPLTTTINNIGPDELFIALKDSWESDDLEKLLNLIAGHIGMRAYSVPPAQQLPRLKLEGTQPAA